MMKNPRNLLIFAVLGGLVGTGFGYTLRAVTNAPQVASLTLKPQDILDVILEQEKAWNAGDIEGFMQGYWKDEALRFSSGGDVTTGWQSTFERYQARYPDKATMGKLDFEIYNVKTMGVQDALVKGHWQLTRDTDTPSGLFTLHMKKIDGDWVIVSDHTSSAN